MIRQPEDTSQMKISPSVIQFSDLLKHSPRVPWLRLARMPIRLHCIAVEHRGMRPPTVVTQHSNGMPTPSCLVRELGLSG